MNLYRKIYLETTTRCNLHCSKCIKQVDGHAIEEGDVSLAVFTRLLPYLGSIEKLVLNGIGEPLLHPNLGDMIGSARSVMDDSAEIGFQTNGHFMTKERARDLVNCGLDNVCFSLDSLEGCGDEEKIVAEPSAEFIGQAIEALHQASDQTGRVVSTGLEIVLDSDNIDQLCTILNWSSGIGIDYVLASHLFPYDRDMARNSLFSEHSRPARDIFTKWQRRAHEQDIDLRAWMTGFKRFANEPLPRMARSLISEMTREAARKGVRLNLESLFEYDRIQAGHVKTVFSEARTQAKQGGIDLYLPELEGLEKRECPFVRDDAIFIAFNGDVMPCHFLWHTYPCMSGTGSVLVQKRRLGNITEMGLPKIWMADEYVQFRQAAESENLSSCWTCPQGPCDDLVNANTLGAHDCYGNEVPCGHCLWNLGALKCL